MNRMIKLSIIVSISLFLFSCQSTPDNTEGLLKKYKQEAAELDKKIESLEKEATSEKNSKAYTGLKVPVSIVQLQPEAFSHYFVATGELESVDEAFVSPEVMGLIVNIYVKEGEQVKKGQKLARLNTEVIEKNISELQSQLDLAETIFNKQNSLWEKNIGSERQYLEAKNNFEGLQNRMATLRSQYDLHIIESPIDGIIEEIFLQKGEVASPGMQFLYVVNIEELNLNAQVSESYMSVIKKGDEVIVSFPSLPDLRMKRKVSRTGNVINKQNRTFTVEIKLDNPDHILKPNMIANIEINDYHNESALVVPSILIRKDLNGSYLYVVTDKDGEKVAQKKYVVAGRSFKDKTEVLEGLDSNSVIITKGYNNVSDGAVLNVIAN